MYIRGLKKEIVWLIITLFILLVISLCGILFLIDRSKEDDEKKTFRTELKEIVKDVKDNCENEIKDGKIHTSIYEIKDNKMELLNKEYVSTKEGSVVANAKCEVTIGVYSENYMGYKNEDDTFYLVEDKVYTTCVLKDDELEIGSTIKCDKESFNVVKIDEDTISMLSVYNINPETNKQDDEDNYSIAFDYINNRRVSLNTYCSSSLYGCNIYEKYDGVFKNGDLEGTIVEDSTIKPYVDSYALKLNLGDNLVEASLITTDVLEELGCSMKDNSCKDTKYPFILRTSFWTKSIFGGSPSIVWHVLSDGVFSGCYANYDNFSGVRPYITIKKEAIETSK